MSTTSKPTPNDLALWLPVAFCFGVAFYLGFEEAFLAKSIVFAVLFFSFLALFIFDHYSNRSLIFLACLLFIAGSYYAFSYHRFFVKDTRVTGKIYANVVGKVESSRKFYNPVNRLEGLNLVLSDLVIFKNDAKSVAKKKTSRKKKVKKSKKSTYDPLTYVQRSPQAWGAANAALPYSEEIKAKKIETKPKKKKTTKPRKPKEKKTVKVKKVNKKTIQEKFINLAGYQEIDREFLDYSQGYQHVDWHEIGGKTIMENPPRKISISQAKSSGEIGVNDVIAATVLLGLPEAPEFPDSFNPAIDAKIKKIDGFGFVSGEIKIVKKAEIATLEQWFGDLRQKIKLRIFAVLDGDIAGISAAFLIGDQNLVSPIMMEKIRNSGLAHLLSISGFHLSLSGMIFFSIARFLMSRSEYLTLHFDLKKFAAVAAIIASFFYLKIAGSPIPAKRAFLMIVMVFIALMVNEKINPKRMIMNVGWLLILLNPYTIFNLSFQLSFVAVLVLAMLYDSTSGWIKHDSNRWLMARIFYYFWQIILVSIVVQIATIPFMMKSFQNVALLGFVSNVLAIPITSFWVMPCGFIALFLMLFGGEKLALILMGKGIEMIIAIANWVGNLSYFHFTSPYFSSLGLIISVIGLLLFCLTQNRLRLLGIAIFIASFLTLFFQPQPDLIFDKNQKFFALHDNNDGLIFSKKLRESKQRSLWMKRFNNNNFQSLDDFDDQWKKQKGIICTKNFCDINSGNQRILILLARNKVTEICQKLHEDPGLMLVNLTGKYLLPDCITSNKIDNLDFYRFGGQIIFFENSQ